MIECDNPKVKYFMASVHVVGLPKGKLTAQCLFMNLIFVFKQ